MDPFQYHKRVVHPVAFCITNEGEMRTFLLFAFTVHLFHGVCAGSPQDSVVAVKEKPSDMRLVVRLHTLGQFSYGGRLVSDNPVMDFNFTYDRKHWGFQLFKAQDLKDSYTPINFTLAVLNTKLHLGKRITITPSAGMILEQSKTVADHGSDAVLILNTAFKISREFTLDQSMLFANLILEPGLRDWVNRLRLLYTHKHIDLVGACWYNNQVFDSSNYVTVSASASYSRIKVDEHVSMNLGVTGLLVAHSSDTQACPAKNGVYVTMAVVFD